MTNDERELITATMHARITDLLDEMIEHGWRECDHEHEIENLIDATLALNPDFRDNADKCRKMLADALTGGGE